MKKGSAAIFVCANDLKNPWKLGVFSELNLTAAVTGLQKMQGRILTTQMLRAEDEPKVFSHLCEKIQKKTLREMKVAPSETVPLRF